MNKNFGRTGKKEKTKVSPGKSRPEAPLEEGQITQGKGGHKR